MPAQKCTKPNGPKLKMKKTTMKNYQTIFAALDLTRMDKALLNYAKYFGGL